MDVRDSQMAARALAGAWSSLLLLLAGVLSCRAPATDTREKSDADTSLEAAAPPVEATAPPSMEAATPLSRETRRSSDDSSRLYSLVPERGAVAYVEAILALPTPSPSPMFRGYPGATRGDELEIRALHDHVSATKIGPGSYASADDPRAHPYDALVMTLRLTNHARTAITTTIPHEWYGGTWPATDLYACARAVDDAADAHAAGWTCQHTYVANERYAETPPTLLLPGGAIELPIRMDWSGTPSIRSSPLLALGKAGSYDVQWLAFYALNGAWRYTLGEVTRVTVLSPSPH